MRGNKNLPAGTAAILIGILNTVIVIYILTTPVETRFDNAETLLYFAEKPLALSFAWYVFAATAVLSYMVVPAVYRRIDPETESTTDQWVRGATLYGLAGFTVLGVWAITLARTVPELALQFAAAREAAVTATASSGFQEIDPDGWFSFGGIGTWLIIVNAAAWKKKVFPGAHAAAGIILGVSHWCTVFAAFFHYEPLNIAASAGGAVFYPLWFIWLGLIFLTGSGNTGKGRAI